MADEDSGKRTAAAADEIYDDRPTHPKPGELPPEVQAPLAAYGGAEPPAPQWFKDAVANAPERTFVESLGTKLEVLTWGEVGKPGLLFVHGNSAHADWWSFVAPFFARDYRVAAFSLAGMGASDWRERYSVADFRHDAEAVAQAAGLHESGRKPVYIGHSFGGAQVFYAAAYFPGQMRAAIIVDTRVHGPSLEVETRKRQEEMRLKAQSPGGLANRVYPTLEAALARFRLAPPQPAGLPFAADFIARRSLRRAPMADGSGEGWTWRFDPSMLVRMDRSALRQVYERTEPIQVPLVHIYGGKSELMADLRSAPSPVPPETPLIEIPEAYHHIMIDQPLALVSAIRALLAAWAK